MGMHDYWIIPSQIFDGHQIVSAQALCVRDGLVRKVVDAKQVPADVQSFKIEGIVTPGFIDLQVNGGAGVLLNQTPTVEGMIAIAEAHRCSGTVAILPTVITDAAKVLDAAADAAISAKGTRGIAGLHIEGPHIAEARRGTHAARHVRPLDDVTIAMARRIRDADVPLMLTLAPEAATAKQISDLAEMGVVVSIGHSDATAAMTRDALDAGVQCFTHLFNAMPPMFNREPGVVGAAINSDAYTGFICDGHHVADEMLLMAMRARPVADRMFLVSDAMPTVAGPPTFDLYGTLVELRDGKLVNEEGSLAGAHVTQMEGVARLTRTLGVSPAEALRMAISIPSDVMGLPYLKQMVNRPIDDIVALSPDLQRLLPLPVPCAVAP